MCQLVLVLHSTQLLTVSEDMVHHPLECHWSIVQAKGNHFKLKQSKWNGKHCTSSEIVMVVEKTWSNTTQWVHLSYQHAATLVVVVIG